MNYCVCNITCGNEPRSGSGAPNFGIIPAYWDVAGNLGRDPQLRKGTDGELIEGIAGMHVTAYTLEPNTTYTYYASPYPFKNGKYPCYTIPPCTFTTRPMMQDGYPVLTATLERNCLPPSGDDPFNYKIQHGNEKSPYGFSLEYSGWKQPAPELPGGQLPNPAPCPAASYPYFPHNF